MESPVSSTESLPALYRAILDLVADLEHRGLRRDAIRIRAEATQVYSTSWDDRGHRRLHQIHERAWRMIRDAEQPVRDRPSAWRRSGSPARAISRRAAAR